MSFVTCILSLPNPPHTITLFLMPKLCLIFCQNQKTLHTDSPGALGKRSYIPDGITYGKENQSVCESIKVMEQKKHCFWSRLMLLLKKKGRVQCRLMQKLLHWCNIFLYIGMVYPQMNGPFSKIQFFWNEYAASVNKVCNASRTSTVTVYCIFL